MVIEDRIKEKIGLLYSFVGLDNGNKKEISYE